METLAPEPANADNNASLDTAQVDAEAVESEGADAAPAAADTGKPPRDRVQERIDNLTREKYEGLSRAERAEYRAQMAEQRLADLEARQTAPQETVAPSDEYPTLESVGWDEDKHRSAVAKWVSKQAGETVKSVLAEERTAAQREQLERDWARKQDAFIKSKPDYADKVGGLPPSLMTDALAAEIKELGNPEVAYYLAENMEKLAEIARLPPKAQARELGRIEARLEASKTAPPPVSKAPPPVSALDSAALKASKQPEEMSDAEWAMENEKERRKRAKAALERSLSLR